MKTLVRVFLSLTACTVLHAQQAAAKPSTPAPCPVQPRILADGTVVKPNADCSTTRIAKGDVVSESTEAVPKSSEVTSPKAVRSASPAPASAPTEVKPEALPADETGPQLRAKYIAATGAYYDYFTKGYVHRQNVFDWQLLSSKIIFVLVILLVAFGVYFAALQFHEGMRRRAAQLASLAASNSSEGGGLPAPPPLEDPTVTTFSASGTGISVSSPVLGVIILVISLAFFYLYLVYVYPITELF